ncbi:MAG: carbohydrate-binding family 9-like protein [Phycisphaerae bacterium]|nr:carbohydrate-binding family 9-like protein [Phycisphaerae bacterium]
MTAKTYTVEKIKAPFTHTGDIDSGIWLDIPIIEINNYMGDEPEHKPRCQAKMVYDSDNLYIIFSVRDNYILSTRTQNQQDIWNDSCVEFFFSHDITKGYLAIEMNCGGRFLLYYKANPQTANTLFTYDQCNQVEVFHSMPKTVNPELRKETTWTVEYKLPLAMCNEYLNIGNPQPGTVWQGNFYKCADECSRPHWLTWSPIDWPKPNFHKPEFFGNLIFE